MVQINRVVTQTSKQIIHERRNEMVSLSSRVVAKPRVIVANKLHELDQLRSNISTFRNQFLKNQHGYLGHFVSMIRMASPEQTLKRGFALVKKGDNIITDPEQITLGDEITIVLKQTDILTIVKDKKQNDGSTDNL
jgi:exodeoxyribonuclease VII large subunit